MRPIVAATRREAAVTVGVGTASVHPNVVAGWLPGNSGLRDLRMQSRADVERLTSEVYRGHDHVKIRRRTG